MFAAWFLPLKGQYCPVVVVGDENGRAVVWKLLNGIVLERVVEYADLYTLPFWHWNLDTKRGYLDTENLGLGNEEIQRAERSAV